MALTDGLPIALHTRRADVSCDQTIRQHLDEDAACRELDAVLVFEIAVPELTAPSVLKVFKKAISSAGSLRVVTGF
jgi:hypothetical protein